MFWTKPRYQPHPTADPIGGKTISIVGESFQQKVLVKALKDQEQQGAAFDVALVAEPNNPYDKRAIRVDIIVRGKPQKAGYIARGETSRWHKVIKQAPRRVIYTWPAELRGGADYPVGLVFFAR